MRCFLFAMSCFVLIGLAACTAVSLGDDTNWAVVPCRAFNLVTSCDG